MHGRWVGSDIFSLAVDSGCHLTYDLEDVLVTSVDRQADAETDTVTESVTLTFAKIELAYTEFDETGSSLSTTEVSWDVETGTVF